MNTRQQQKRVIPRRGFGNFHEPANISQLPCCSVFLGFLGFSRPANSKVLLSCKEMLRLWRLSYSAWRHQGQSKRLSSPSPGVLPAGVQLAAPGDLELSLPPHHKQNINQNHFVQGRGESVLALKNSHSSLPDHPFPFT